MMTHSLQVADVSEHLLLRNGRNSDSNGPKGAKYTDCVVTLCLAAQNNNQMQRLCPPSPFPLTPTVENSGAHCTLKSCWVSFQHWTA